MDCADTAQHCYRLCVPGPRRDPAIPVMWGVPKIAAELGVSRTEVRRLMQSGKLPCGQVINETGDGVWVARPEIVAEHKAKRDAKSLRRGGDADSDRIQGDDVDDLVENQQRAGVGVEP